MLSRPGPYVRLHNDLRHESGAVLVLTLLLMVVVLGIASYAIDTGIWFVHHGHLQTQADAAALAAAQQFQYPCTPGGTMDQQIASTVHRYDGTTATTGGYNAQVSVTPTASSTYSASQHNLIAEIDQPNYAAQSQPGDSELTGSPCADGAIDVKLTETNLSSFIPIVSPKFINAQARVGILQETSAIHAEPFAEPLPTPNTLTAFLVDQSTGQLIAGPVTLTPSADHTTWTTSAPLSVLFEKATAGGIVGLRVAMSGGTTATCGSAGVSCYASDSVSPPIGVAYTRVWSNSGTPGLPTTAPIAPQLGNATLSPSGATGCPNAPSGTFSNFISSSSSCQIALSAAMVFTGTGGTALTCTTASLVLKAAGKNVNTACPSGGPNGTWTSVPVTISPNAGPTSFTLSWKLTAGKKPAGAGVTGGDNSSNCTPSKPCEGSFDSNTAATPEVVQRVYSGAYDSLSEASSNSGPILSATVADATTGSELMSVPRSEPARSVAITVTVLGFQNSQTIPSPPIELSFGGNQENAALECTGNAGNPAFEEALVKGCPDEYGTTTAPAATACAGSPTPPVCAKENPGGGKLVKDLDRAMNQRINGGANTCVNPNHWASPNSVGQVVGQTPPDPRLITTIITDYGALGNGASEVPVRAFAEFYVTGWSGDPCIGEANGTSSNGLAYTHDDNPGSNKGVLLGHFVKYVATSSTGTGSTKCSQSSFGNCIAVLTR
jgi:Flp pilus assembly protein TadG